MSGRGRIGLRLGNAIGFLGANMTLTLYKWTVDRYHAAIDAGLFDDQPVELLQGDIVVMAPEREAHACYSSDAAEYLRRLLGDRAAVRETKPVLVKDLSIKQQIYAEAGIQEYWVSDLKNGRLQVFRDGVNGGYQTEWTLTTGTISPLAFPEVAIEVQRLFS